jgi:RNA polymerase sigma-70 factor, ECF subfamily
LSFFTRYFDDLTDGARRNQPEAVSTNDAALLRRAADGDEEACRTFVQRHGPKLGAIIDCAHGDLHLTDDIVQESFIRAIQHAHQLTDASSVFPWLVRIATRVAIDNRRKVRNETLAPPPSDRATDDSETPEQQAAAHQDAAHLRRALESLDPKTRELIVLRYYSSFSVSELSAVFDKTEAAIRKDLQRARHRLRRTLGRWFQGDPLR